MSESPTLTPLMQQFWSIKNQHRDKILLFRMGDFYEMFHEDAKIAAPILNIALTSRNKKAEDETPMCGVPHHSIATPISKLLAAGWKVAICDQLEDPETAKGIVKRGVTRVLSPGMVYDPETLSELAANYVACADDESVSFLEASTGECFYYRVRTTDEALRILGLLRPTELVLSSAQFADSNSLIVRMADGLRLHKSVHDDVETQWPERFVNAPRSALRLLGYATSMQGPQLLAALKPFEERSLLEAMALGENVIKHLEIFENSRGEDRGSLFGALNRTRTSAGARMLKSWLRFPLVRRESIEARLDRVEEWTKKPSDLKILRQKLGQMGDIERRLAKISYNNCHVRDIIALAQSLRVGIDVSPFCEAIDRESVELAEALCARVSSTLTEDPPLNMKNGGYVRGGWHAELDELIALSENGQKLLLDLEQRERETTQISSLKIRYNNVFGYYIEVTNTHKDKVPDHYKRKQTLANAERYITQELDELESRILSSRERRVQLEEKILADLRQHILVHGPAVLALAQEWSKLDVLASLAWLAIEQNYSRPRFSDGRNLELERSRHPVVEQEVSRTFVPNSLSLKRGECLLLTGPNMAGKSTLMRQVAVTVLMGQMGSFVPAAKAQWSIYERIFTRIGASDSLSEGLSTFMVEMRETAEMLSGADDRTLVVLDEVGRGTSTYDGMSLAQAILEHLIRVSKSMTLFATHYHEITELANDFSEIRNAHMAIQERGHDIQFLYSLKSGPANKSYGIQVARLAGLPASVVDRATSLLRGHETRRQAKDDLPLLTFAAQTTTDTIANINTANETGESQSAGGARPEGELIEKLRAFNALESSPLQALNQIVEWQQELS